jgi:hypothetical protein
MASPIFVRWNRRNSTPTVAEPPDPAREAVQEDEEAERDDDERERLAALEVPDQAALDGHPGEEREGQRCQHRQAERNSPRVQAPGDEGAEHGHLALGEVDDARRPEDQDERQRERGVDRAGGYPVDDDLYEALHDLPQ